MLVRIVRMTFRPDRLDAFRSLFEQSAPKIRSAPGCRFLSLLEDARYPNILATYSLWETPEDLERYRASELFRSTWAQTKPHFAAPPVANSFRAVVGPTPGEAL